MLLLPAKMTPQYWLPARQQNSGYDKLSGESSPDSEAFFDLGPKRKQLPTLKRALLQFLFALSFILLAATSFRYVSKKLKILSITNTSNSLNLMGKTRPQGLKVAMIMSKPDKNFCRSLYSTLVNNYPPPSLIHFNKSFRPGGWIDKIDGFEQYSNSLGKKEVAILLDGYDIWFQLPAETALNRFKAMGKELVLGADKKCYPNAPDTQACTNVHDSPLSRVAYGPLTDIEFAYTRPKWACAGTQMGTGKGLANLYRGVVANQNIWDGKVNDQGILNEIITDNPDFTYTVDHRSRVFQTLTHSHSDIAWEANPDPSNLPHLYANDEVPLRLDMSDFNFQTEEDRRTSEWNGRVLARNVIANTIPVSLHFNGEKEYLEWWWPRMWFSELNYRTQALYILSSTKAEGTFGAWDGDIWHPWSELCGDQPIFE